MSKIALGTWAWGAGAFGGDAVFGSKTDVEIGRASLLSCSIVSSALRPYGL